MDPTRTMSKLQTQTRTSTGRLRSDRLRYLKSSAKKFFIVSQERLSAFSL
jgi:hypothetical protein